MGVPDSVVDTVIAVIKEISKKNQIEPHTVQWNDFVKYMSEYAKSHNLTFSNDISHKIKQAGGFRNIRDTHFIPQYSNEYLAHQDLSKHNRKLAAIRARDNSFLEKYQAIGEKIFKNAINVPKIRFTKKPVVERALHLIHSDNHIGSFLDPREGLVKFSSVEAARRLAYIGVQLADFKPQYRKNTILYINSIGDLIDGIIHKKFKGYNLAEQVCMASSYMLQWLVFLAPQFPAGIVVNCLTGNHDRLPEIHPDRATEDKSNSYATLVYYSVKQAIELAKIPNIKINIPRSAWITYKCFGANYFATHGDTIVNIGNVGSSINIKSIENQINHINSSLEPSERCNVFMLGHVHTRALLTMNNGVELIVNPPLIPADGYAHSIGIFQSQTGQQLVESVPGFPAGDSRFLKVNTDTDKDASLDKIIKPFTDF